MQQFFSHKLITPVRRISPPSWACHGTSAPFSGVTGVMDIADYTQIGKPKHACPWIEINSDDLLRFFHTRRILIGARNAAIDD